MGSIEKKGRTARSRLHWIDWVILVTVTALLLGGAWWLTAARRERGESVAIVYTLSLSAVRIDDVDENGGWEALMPVGASVTNEKGSRMLGTVEAVTVLPTLVPTVSEGEAVFVQQSRCVDLYVRVRADALYREGDCYRVGDLPILCGTAGDFRIGAYCARGCRIVRVEGAVTA